jgi:hypothetical protein
MKLVNNTEQPVNFWVDYEGGGDCGSISGYDSFPGYPSWDNESLTVEFVGLPDEEAGGTALSVTIPETKPGMAVTIGLYYE